MVSLNANWCCRNTKRRNRHYISFYGSTLRLVQQAANELLEVGDCEIIDLQSLLPFDVNQDVVKVLLKQIAY
jgi:pyruvate/2-oxoglutarate/acetoin dehydrogenase E1 component